MKASPLDFLEKIFLPELTFEGFKCFFDIIIINVYLQFFLLLSCGQPLLDSSALPGQSKNGEPTDVARDIIFSRLEQVL